MGQGLDKKEFPIQLQLSKSAYLLILMLISVCFFHFKAIAKYTDFDICLIAFFLWLILGHFLYKPLGKWLSISLHRDYWPMYLFWLGVVISFFPARSLFGQSFRASFVVSRNMLTLLALPFLFVIKPSRQDIEKAAKWFSVILLVFSILDAMGIPIIDRSFFIDEDRPRKLIADDEFVMLLPGFQWVGISLCFCLDRLKKVFSTRNLLSSLFFFAAVFLLQNRTMLFTCAVFFVYTFLPSRGKPQNRQRLSVTGPS